MNNSPLAGREGKQVTFPAIKKRLEKEIEGNISLSLKSGAGESIEVLYFFFPPFWFTFENLSKRFLVEENYNWLF